MSPAAPRTLKEDPMLDLETICLAKGAHDNPAEGGCVMEWVSVAAGEEFTDHPSCTSNVIAAFLRSWNDVLPDDDRQQLKRYIPVIGSDGEVLSAGVMGTAASSEVEDMRAWMACDWLVRVYTPAWLRLAGLTEQADRLAGLGELSPATVPTIRPVIEAVRSDAVAAGAAAWDAAGDAAWVAARDAAGDAAWDAAWVAARDAAGAAAWDAAWVAARVAAGAAAWDAAWVAARVAAGDAAGAAAGAAAWDAAGVAARAAAGVAARAAAGVAARAAAGVAAGAAARAAARTAAGAALLPTVVELQVSVHGLLARMIAVQQ